jgi:hypothetical protein
MLLVRVAMQFMRVVVSSPRWNAGANNTLASAEGLRELPLGEAENEPTEER